MSEASLSPTGPFSAGSSALGTSLDVAGDANGGRRVHDLLDSRLSRSFKVHLSTIVLVCNRPI